jgi:hypothetical protein
MPSPLLYYYSLYGLNISSSVELTGYQETKPDIIDIEIKEGSIPDSLSNSNGQNSYLKTYDNEILLETSDSGKFLIQGDDKVTFEKHSHAVHSDISTIITNVVLGLILYKKRKWALHASAIEYNGKAYVLCGPKGMGKSILAAALIQEGASLISDDITCLEIKDDQIYALPGNENLCLWPDSIKTLGQNPENRTKLRPSIEKRFVKAQRFSNEKYPVDSLFFINRNRTDNTTQDTISLLKPFETVLLLDRNTCSRMIFKESESTFPFFQEAIQLTKKADIYSLSRLYDLPTLEDSTSILLNYLNKHTC